MSRQLISRANQLFNGRAALGGYQQGKPGGEVMLLYRFKPVGNRAIVFTGAPAAGATSATLTANWGGTSGIFLITFSDGETLNAVLTNGATTCTFLPSSFPQTIGSTGPYGGTGALVNAVTVNATVAGQPPVVGTANSVSLTQAVASGAGALLNGTTAGVLDVPRNVIAAWTGAAILTITGTDFYGQTQTEASASGTTFTGKKAFATITSAVFGAAVTAATIGTGNALGLPFKVGQGDIMDMYFNNGVDASTLVVGDTTFPATSSTGDVRGTVTAAGTLNGSSVYTALIKPLDPNTQVGLFGVTPA
jgi:hypothetical protein